MKTPVRSAFTCTLMLATTHSLRAEFLVLKIRETTAENVWHWIIAVFAAIIFLTLRASRNKGGQGR
jgi:hypothetical protein